MIAKNHKLIQSVVKLRDRPPKTREELDHYLRHFYGIFLPNVPIEKGNSCPLDFVWDIYSTAMGINPNPSYNILGMATRGGGKSLACAAIEMLMLHHDKTRNWFHMASIYQQAHVTYDYFKKIATRPIMAGVVKEPTMRETQSNHGTKLKIGTATMDSVNSFHGSVIQDEIDLTAKGIFDESKGMLSAEQGRMPLNVCISSRKYAFGNVQRLLNDSVKDSMLPLRVHKWGILEITAKCMPDRHGGEFGVPIYVNEDELIAISQEQYQSMSPTTPDFAKYSKEQGYKNCLSCGIFSFCKGRLPNQADNNPYLQPIDSTKVHFKMDAPDFFQAQRLNRKPSSKGLVYSMWDELIHEKTYAQMWEIFKGEKHKDIASGVRTSLTFNELVSAFIEAGVRCVVGVDFGFSVLAVAGLYFIDGSGRVYFVAEIAHSGMSDAELAAQIKKEWGHLPVDMVYADPESPGGKKEIRKATDWAVSEEVDKDVDAGLGTVRRFMRLPGTKDTLLYVAPACTVFRSEVKTYHNKIDPKTDEPIDEVVKVNDHSCDQLRYVIQSIFGGINWNLDFHGQLGVTGDRALTQAPTATEFAQKLGVPFNDNRSEYDLESGKRKEPVVPKGTGGSGFNWSF